MMVWFWFWFHNHIVPIKKCVVFLFAVVVQEISPSSSLLLFQRHRFLDTAQIQMKIRHANE